MAIPLKVIREARACEVCTPHLPLGPRPLLGGNTRSRVVIIGQAPGRLAHESGVPWDDPSGQRLRSWLGVDDETFYDESRFALMPMGFCFPGTGKSGDMAPRLECAPLWHDRMLESLKSVELRVYIGKYAIDAYLNRDGKRFGSVTDAVRAWDALLPGEIVLPHPSGRNNIWLKKNPWFAKKTLPALRRRVARLISA